MKKIFIFLICSFLGINAAEEQNKEQEEQTFFAIRADTDYKNVILNFAEYGAEKEEIKTSTLNFPNDGEQRFYPLSLDKMRSKKKSKIILTGGIFFLILKNSSKEYLRPITSECSIELTKKQGACIVAHIGPVTKIINPNCVEDVDGSKIFSSVDTVKFNGAKCNITPIAIEFNN
jgi:hypothetical protein